jgi:hypothetical protein
MGPSRGALAGRGALLFSLAIFAVLAYAAYEINTGFTARARLFANAITLPALVLAGYQAVREARRVIPLPVPLEAVVSRSALIWKTPLASRSGWRTTCGARPGGSSVTAQAGAPKA